jgi:leucyl aminopeptidase
MAEKTKTKQVLMGLTMSLLASSAFADARYVVLPTCLGDAVKGTGTTLAVTKTHRLMSIDTKEIETVRKMAHRQHCGGFIDVTHRYTPSIRQHLDYSTFLKNFKPQKVRLTNAKPFNISHEKVVSELVKHVEPNNIWDTLTSLTHFSDRSASTDTGVKAAHWLKDNFDKMAQSAHRDDVNSYFVETGWYKQPSVVTVIGKDIKADAVVVGGHMDTLSYSKPGADDDGSGSSSIMEAARVILNSKEKLTHPVYFIWYAAEERGLVGSGYVVEDFIDKKIPVKAVIQFDMTGYRYHNSDKMWLLADNVDTELSQFVAKLIETYVGAPIGWTKCGYGCSDHASWHYEGFKAAAPFEAKFGEEDPYIHTGDDTMEYVSRDHMTNFSKLAVAFVGELAS